MSSSTDINIANAMSKCDDCGNIIFAGWHGPNPSMPTMKVKRDENLLQPLPNEECPICFLTIPSLITGRKYKTCCGKIICSGCIHAVNKMKGDAKCPFCRVPVPRSDEDLIEMIQKRVEMNDAVAIYSLYGLPQDWDKALELWHRAAELGYAPPCYNIGCAYYYGRGVERDMKKAKHYWELEPWEEI